VTLRVLSYNIRYGGTGREDALLSVIKASAPDLVIFQEATRPEVIARLAQGAAMGQWASERGRSLGFMAREPVAHYAWHQPRLSRHAFLEVIPHTSGVRVVGVHLSAVHSAWTERRRGLELRALLRTLSQRERGFHVLVGDFNTLAPGELLDIRKLPRRLRPFVWLSGGRIRWRAVQSVLDAGYADAFRQLHTTQPGFTFPTWDPHLRLDYLFVPAGDVARIESCEVVTGEEATRASDHLPLMSNLTV
jgi:endonuclease/exonuclease/phosphatase family metal-dependent hydrolase